MRFATVVVALWLLAMIPAPAETVYVRSGQREGQGWMFLNATGCWVATAGHVVIDGANAIVVGPNGVQAQAARTVRHPVLDVALLQLAGFEPRDCPSSLGDRDERSILDRLQHEGGSMAFERRSGKAGRSAGISYGIEAIEMRLIGVSETEPTFTVRAVEAARDRIVQSDSGGPIRFRGTAIGEAGLPLGLVLDVRRDTITALRMDAVRGFVESMAPAIANSADALAPFSVVAFTGQTPESACAPLNVLDAAAPCGWRARSPRAGGITLTLDLGPNPVTISAVLLRFEPEVTPRGFEISTGPDPHSSSDWYGQRYCRISPGAHQTTCTLGTRTARGIRIIMDGPAAYLREVRIVGGS